MWSRLSVSGLMLVGSQLHLPNIKQTLGECMVFAGKWSHCDPDHKNNTQNDVELLHCANTNILSRKQYCAQSSGIF